MEPFNCTGYVQLYALQTMKLKCKKCTYIQSDLGDYVAWDSV